MLGRVHHYSTGAYAGDTQQDRRRDQDLAGSFQSTPPKQQTRFSAFPPRSKKQNLKMNRQFLEEDPFPTYHGMTFDRRLTWKQQINKCCSWAKARLAIIKKLAGTDWGADQRILKKLYTGRVRPVPEYGISAWDTASKPNFHQIYKVQNQAERLGQTRRSLLARRTYHQSWRVRVQWGRWIFSSYL